MKKQYLCEICGDNELNNFYKSLKSKCKKCKSNQYKNRIDKKEYIKKQSEWTNKNIIKFRLLAAKNRALRDGIEFCLNKEIIEEKLKLQNNKCFISKVPISFETKNPHSISIDRIDSNLGYTENNTIIVTKFINICKNDYSLDDFYKLLKEVSNNLKD
jgi:hypothetical protein